MEKSKRKQLLADVNIDNKKQFWKNVVVKSVTE